MAGRKQATKMTSTAAMALLVVALLAVVAVAPAAATGYTVCGVNLGDMKGACEAYCARGSREAWPGNACCNAVRGADFPCLCRLNLKRVIQSMGTIDATRAMQIPSKCGISGVPASC